MQESRSQASKRPPYGQRIALFGARAARIGPRRPLVQRASWFFYPAEAPWVQRVEADVARFDVAELVEGEDKGLILFEG